MEQHFKRLGYLFIIWSLVVIGFVASIPYWMNPNRATMQTLAFKIFIVVFSVVMLFIILTGWSLLARKPWSRKAAIVASILELPSIPVGIAIGIYGLWAMLSEDGKKAFPVYVNQNRTEE